MSQKKHEALSIPNLITYFRLLLIPVFVLTYFEAHYIWSLVVLLVSGLSDVADGYIARHYDLVTDIGKIVDPVADKLTQATMIFCVAWHIPAMWLLLALLVIKELTMLFWGWYTLRRTGTVNSARWYGKVCTFILYACMATLVLLPGLSYEVTWIIAIVCAAAMLMSLILYSRWYIIFLRQQEKTPDQQAARNMTNSHVSVVMLEIIVAIVLVSAAMTIIHRSDLSLDAIVSFTPSNLWLAALVFMGLYALKSVTAVVYLKLLYIAAGVVFPFPIALAVNIVGTALEMSIPYLVGRFGGQRVLEAVMLRRPRLQQIKTFQQENNRWFSILSRGVGILPADALSIYFGANEMPYCDFIFGGVIGLLPSMIIATVMGLTLEDPGSAGFIISVALFVIVQASAAIGFTIWIKKRSAENKSGGKKEQPEHESA